MACFQRSHIPEVAGSSPAGPTNDYKGLGSLPNLIFCSIIWWSSQEFEGEEGRSIPKFVLTYLLS